MRTLVVGAALATLIAMPAFAQSYDPNTGSGNLVFPPGAANRSNPIVAPRATDYVRPEMAHSYAYAPDHGSVRAKTHRVHFVHKTVRHPRRKETQD
jgi:hypothetical protein